MFRLAPVVTAILLVTASGMVHGFWTGRWSNADVVNEAATRMASIPLIAGEWEGHELEMSPRELRLAEAAGSLQRRYVNRRTGSAVTMMLLCGKPGPISVHTPDVCYRGSGFDEIGDAVRFTPEGETDTQLWVRRFRKDSAMPVMLRVMYGWSSSGPLEAPDYPRLTFGSRPVLFKLYLVREMLSENEVLDKDPAFDLLRALRPQLRAAMTAELRRSS